MTIISGNHRHAAELLLRNIWISIRILLSKPESNALMAEKCDTLASDLKDVADIYRAGIEPPKGEKKK